MAKIPWGKPTLFTFKEGSTVAYKLPTPVEDSTELSSEKGDKLEAKIEGGANEDVKYKRSTYGLAFNIRKLTGRKPPYPSVDGVVNDIYGMLLMPEDPTTEGFYIERGSVSIDEPFTAADGAMWNCQLDALEPEEGNTVKWGTVEVSGDTITFTERSSASGQGIVKTFTLAVQDDTTVPAGNSGTSETYYEVKNPKGNPALKNYYERTGEGTEQSPYVYTLTTDVTVTTGKTYYIKG